MTTDDRQSYHLIGWHSWPMKSHRFDDVKSNCTSYGQFHWSSRIEPWLSLVSWSLAQSFHDVDWLMMDPIGNFGSLWSTSPLLGTARGSRPTVRVSTLNPFHPQIHAQHTPLDFEDFSNFSVSCYWLFSDFKCTYELRSHPRSYVHFNRCYMDFYGGLLSTQVSVDISIT